VTRPGGRLPRPLTLARPLLGVLVSGVAAALVLAACSSSDAGGPEGPGDADATPGFDVQRDVTLPDARLDLGPEPDVGEPDAGPDPDLGPPPDEGHQTCLGFLAPCEFNPDCCDGWCVIGPDGVQRVCSQVCTSEACPEGWGCTQVGTPPDVQFVCIPRRPPTCFQPCRSDADCTADHRCLPIGEGRFCSRGCDDGQGNPNPSRCDDQSGDYACAAAVGLDGTDVGLHCQPVTGSCVCGPEINLEIDLNNCGDCGHVCDFENGVADCQGGECVMIDCAVGWVDLDQDGLDCEYECDFESDEDLPDPFGVDSNCDGIDGILARAVFVAPAGSDAGNTLGDRDHPFQTIGAAIAFASLQDTRKDVFVSIGTYEEQVILAAGVNLYGGYNRSDGWRRTIADNPTYVVWSSVENGAIRTMLALGGSAPTVVDGFIIRAGNNPIPGGSSYALYATHVGREFVFSHNRIEAGSGADGLDGADGVDGQNGPVGGRGEDGKPDYCNTDYYVAGGQRGANQCGGWDASGGEGGWSGYGKEDGWFCEGRPDGEDGDRAPAGADGGAGGGYEDNGEEGEDGLPGVDGADGSGGSAAGTIDTFGLWQAAPGGAGSGGSDGVGGGGGGGGGGRKKQETPGYIVLKRSDPQIRQI